jgi:hypothetical protein
MQIVRSGFRRIAAVTRMPEPIVTIAFRNQARAYGIKFFRTASETLDSPRLIADIYARPPAFWAAPQAWGRICSAGLICGRSGRTENRRHDSFMRQLARGALVQLRAHASSTRCCRSRDATGPHHRALVTLHDPRRHLPGLRCFRQAWRATAPRLITQAVRSRRIVAMHPIAQRLAIHGAGLGCPAPRPAFQYRPGGCRAQVSWVRSNRPNAKWLRSSPAPFHRRRRITPRPVAPIHD